MLQLINKQIGNSGKLYQDIWLHNNLKKTTHPQMVAETLNAYFIDKVEELVEINKSKDSDRLSQLLVDCNPHSMYFFQFLKNK
jgi:hypothetical protein